MKHNIHPEHDMEYTLFCKECMECLCPRCTNTHEHKVCCLLDIFNPEELDARIQEIDRLLDIANNQFGKSEEIEMSINEY